MVQSNSNNMRSSGRASFLARKLFLVFLSILSSLIVLLTAEALTRFLGPHINYQSTDHRLIREKAFGKSIGWQPRSSGVSFGQLVHIDEDGFRDLHGPAEYEEAWLVLGDSITFGVGVPWNKTFIGLLQQHNPKIKIWQTSVIAYSVFNYRDVIHHFLKSGKKISRVLMFYALNDVHGYIESLPRSAPKLSFKSLKTFLKRHSKLYMVAKNILFNRSKDRFEFHSSIYRDEKAMRSTFDAIDEIADTAEQMGAHFDVILLPFEYQLRVPDTANLYPQQLVSDNMKKRGLSCIDAFSEFQNAAITSKHLFLYADSMHLSPLGHEAVFELLQKMKLGTSDHSTR